MALQRSRHRFTSAEFERMATAGVFGEDDRLELLDGEIVEMSPIGRRHVACVDRLAERLFQIAHGAAIVRVQSPTPLGEHVTPQPDVALLRRRADYYADAPSSAADVLLLVEVAERSVEYDRAKWPQYARSGVPEAWLVDPTRDAIEVHRDPAGDNYRTVLLMHRGDRINCLAFPEETVVVAEILG